MPKNSQHYLNIDRGPHCGDMVKRNGTPFVVGGHPVQNPTTVELVTPWWAVDAKPGAQVRDGEGDVWTLRDDSLWTLKVFSDPGKHEALDIEKKYGPCERVTPDQPTIPAPASRLTDEQVDALHAAHRVLLERHWELSEALENAFPEAFAPEPKHPWDIPLEVRSVVAYRIGGKPVVKVIASEDEVDLLRKVWTENADRITDWQHWTPSLPNPHQA